VGILKSTIAEAYSKECNRIAVRRRGRVGERLVNIIVSNVCADVMKCLSTDCKTQRNYKQQHHYFEKSADVRSPDSASPPNSVKKTCKSQSDYCIRFDNPAGWAFVVKTLKHTLTEGDGVGGRVS